MPSTTSLELVSARLAGPSGLPGCRSRSGSFSVVTEATENPSEQNAVPEIQAKQIQFSVPLELNAHHTAVWTKMRMNEFERLGKTYFGECRRLGFYPYLYELHEKIGDEGIYKLATLVSEVLGQIKEPSRAPEPVAQKLPMKSCLKHKNYVINFDGSLFEQAIKNATKRVTKKDLEKRQEYITNTIKRENELFAVELQFLAQSPQIEHETRVQLSDSPRYLRLIDPDAVLRDGPFNRSGPENGAGN